MSDGDQGTGVGAGGSGEGGEGSDGRDVGPGEGGRDVGSGEGGEGSDGRDAGSGEGGERSDSRDLGGSEDHERLAADSGGQDSAHGAYAVETPEQLLAEVKAVRRRARFARHAYWFPLILFGLLTCAAIPFYIQRIPRKSGFIHSAKAGVRLVRGSYLSGLGPFTSSRTPYYWLAAILVGVAATAAWYRWRGSKIGLRTPARGYLLTGMLLLLLALGIPALAATAPRGLMILTPGDLLIRGTFPLVIIGIGLCSLAWAERSVALTVIAVGYLALSLVASLYDIENVFYRLGWNISPDYSGLPNVVLPALVLLLSGAGAWLVQRRTGHSQADTGRAAGSANDGPSDQRPRRDGAPAAPARHPHDRGGGQTGRVRLPP